MRAHQGCLPAPCCVILAVPSQAVLSFLSDSGSLLVCVFPACVREPHGEPPQNAQDAHGRHQRAGVGRCVSGFGACFHTYPCSKLWRCHGQCSACRWLRLGSSPFWTHLVLFTHILTERCCADVRSGAAVRDADRVASRGQLLILCIGELAFGT